MAAISNICKHVVVFHVAARLYVSATIVRDEDLKIHPCFFPSLPSLFFFTLAGIAAKGQTTISASGGKSAIFGLVRSCADEDRLAHALTLLRASDTLIGAKGLGLTTTCSQMLEMAANNDQY